MSPCTIVQIHVLFRLTLILNTHVSPFFFSVDWKVSHLYVYTYKLNMYTRVTY